MGNPDIQTETEQPRSSEVLNSAFTPINASLDAAVLTEPALPVISQRAAMTTEPHEVEQEGEQIASEAVAGNANELLDAAVETDTQAETVKDDLAADDTVRGDSRAMDNLSAVPQQKLSSTFTGLAATRSQSSSDWLAGLPDKTGYTIQVFSVLTRQPEKLEEFLLLLENNEMSDHVFLCVISRNDSRAEQWVVLYNEFSGLSQAQKLIEGFPSYISQYAPFARNLHDVECAN